MVERTVESHLNRLIWQCRKCTAPLAVEGLLLFQRQGSFKVSRSSNNNNKSNNCNSSKTLTSKLQVHWSPRNCNIYPQCAVTLEVQPLPCLFPCWALVHRVYSWEAFPGFSPNPPFISLAVLAVHQWWHSGSATHRDTLTVTSWLRLLALQELIPC